MSPNHDALKGSQSVIPEDGDGERQLCWGKCLVNVRGQRSDLAKRQQELLTYNLDVVCTVYTLSSHWGPKQGS